MPRDSAQTGTIREPFLTRPTGWGWTRWLGPALALILVVGGCARTGPERRPAPAEVSEEVVPVVDRILSIPWANAVAAGAGNVWVASSSNDGTSAGSIFRIDTDSGEIVAEIPVTTVPGWVTGGDGLEVAGGSVWVVGGIETPGGLDSPGGGSDGLLLRVDPATNRVVQEIPLSGFSAGDVAVDERGVWVSLSTGGGGGSGLSELVRVDPDRGEVVARTRLTQEYARDVIAIDGAIWVHEHEVGGPIGRESVFTRVDPETGRLLASVPTGLHVVSVTVGEGTIWGVALSESGEGNVLLKLDPLTGDLATIPAGDLDHLLDYGEGGIWGRGVRSTGEVGVVRFIPQSGQVDAWVPLSKEASSPVALAVALASVWVVNYEHGVTRIELRRA
jgi:hypothetical protein